MTEALDKLIAAVEAGSWDGSWRWLLDNILDSNHCRPFSDAYHGSLDAAVALKDALLTKDCYWRIEEDDDLGFVAHVYLGGLHRGESVKPSRALLLATLRAVQEDRRCSLNRPA